MTLEHDLETRQIKKTNFHHHVPFTDLGRHEQVFSYQKVKSKNYLSTPC